MVKTALVIAPHADDETFGCGGTIAKMTDQGIQVDLLLGSLGYDKDSLQVREQELQKAIEILGISKYNVITNLGAERYQDKVPQYNLIDAIESVIRIRQYDVVFIPYPSHHQDHIAVHQACLAALRPGTFQPNMILMYEYTYPTWVVPDQYNGRMFVDITTTIARKAMAIDAYKSQLRRQYSPVSVRSAIVMASARGLSIQVQFAEMFYVIQMKNIL